MRTLLFERLLFFIDQTPLTIAGGENIVSEFFDFASFFVLAYIFVLLTFSMIICVS